MSLLEQVARVIADELRSSENAFVSADDLRNCRLDGHFNLIEVAEVAIEALRIPNDAMIRAAEALDSPQTRDGRATAEEHWSAMIEAVLGGADTRAL